MRRRSILWGLLLWICFFIVLTIGIRKVAERRFHAKLKAFLAVAKEDISLCTDKDCLDDAQRLLVNRYIGEGLCEKIVEEDTVRQHCYNLKAKDCTLFTNDFEQKACQMLISGDLIPLHEMAEKDDTARIEQRAARFGVLVGYQRKSYQECDKYIARYVRSGSVYSYVCKIVFSDDPQKTFENIDHAY